MEENPTLYRYTNFHKIALVTNEIKIAPDTDNERFCVLHWLRLIKDPSMLIKIVRRGDIHRVADLIWVVFILLVSG